MSAVELGSKDCFPINLSFKSSQETKDELTSRKVRSFRAKPSLIVQHLKECAKSINDSNAKFFALRDTRKDKVEELAKALVSDPLSRNSRLLGLAFSAKDHIDVAGLSRSEGNKRSLQAKVESSCAAIQRLEDAGAICIGKSNMSEYGKSYYTDNKDFGRSSNPFNPEHSPGGSSGGDAIAVSTKMVDFGLGADSGGSVRIPASFCGVFGLMPSPGSVSNYGLSNYPVVTKGILRELGPIARSLDDLHLVFSTLSGYDPRDPRSCPIPVGAERDIKRSGKFVVVSELGGVPCDAEIGACLQKASAELESLGFQAHEASPAILEQAYEPFIVLAGPTSLMLDDLVQKQLGIGPQLQDESPALQKLRQRIANELPPLSPEMILSAWHQVGQMRLEASRFFEEYDFILSPVAACQPPKHGTTDFKIGSESFQSQQVFQFASAVNVLGLPALAFPCCLSKSGLPLGLQLISRKHSDFHMIDLLAKTSYQQALELP